MKRIYLCAIFERKKVITFYRSRINNLKGGFIFMSETQLLELVRRISRERSLSRKTENAYINHIRRFYSFYAKRNLEEVGANGINAFLNHLKTTKNLAISTQNQALSALSFLYRDVFGQASAPCLKTFKRTKPSGKLPEIFTSEEARAVLLNLHGDAFLTAALMYGSGLRLSEAVGLRIGDIDFEKREITVRDALTGAKDRTTILPDIIIPVLKRHFVNVRYIYEDDCLLGYGKIFLPNAIIRKHPNAVYEWRWQFAFPSHNLTVGKTIYRYHLAESTVQKAVSEAIEKANISKQAGCQTFRYSFAVRLFEKNYDIHQIQNLLGHKNLKTTMIYMQFAQSNLNVVRSPLDS
jgi:integron integrase